MHSKLRNYCNFGAKSSRRAWHVIPEQEVNKVPINTYLIKKTQLTMYSVHVCLTKKKKKENTKPNICTYVF